MRIYFFIVIIIFLCVFNLFSQVPEQSKNNILSTPEHKNASLNLKKQHWASIYTSIEAISIPSHSTAAFSISGLELFLGSKLFFYGKLGFYFSIPVNNSYVYNKAFYGGGIGGVLGIGGYIFNKRDVETLKGWSLMLNGGLSIKGGLFHEFYKNTPSNTEDLMILLMGGEINLKIIYNINRYLGFFLNPNFGAYGLSSFCLSYGLSVGLAF